MTVRRERESEAAIEWLETVFDEHWRCYGYAVTENDTLRFYLPPYRVTTVGDGQSVRVGAFRSLIELIDEDYDSGTPARWPEPLTENFDLGPRSYVDATAVLTSDG